MKINSIEAFKELDLGNFSVEPLVKLPTPPDNRGFIYIVVDSAFPRHFKLGRTIDMKKRLMQYNSDKPYPTARVAVISDMFEDVVSVEKDILKYLYHSSPPTTFSREWFYLDLYDDATNIIKLAEDRLLTNPQ